MASLYSPLHDDVEWGDKFQPTQDFARQTVRQGFVRKVLGLLAAQLLLTTVIGGSIVFSPSVKGYVGANPWTLWLSIGGSFGIIIALACSEDLRRKHPTNLIMLFAFTACEGVLVGAASSVYNTNLVVLAAAVTTAVVCGLAVFAMQSKVDAASWGGVLFACLSTLIFASLLQIFIHASWLHLAIICGSCLVFSAYLVYDLQMIMGNNGRMAISPDEYVMAALNIYLDIINLFINILRLLHELTKER